MPHLLELFNDENKEVREAVMQSSAQFCTNIGFDTVGQFIPLFKKSLEDDKNSTAPKKNHWRVRLETYKALIKIATNFHNPDFFQK